LVGSHIFEANNWINGGWQTGEEYFNGSVTINTASLEGDSPTDPE
jgi:hypothetical protein